MGSRFFNLQFVAIDGIEKPLYVPKRDGQPALQWDPNRHGFVESRWRRSQGVRLRFGNTDGCPPSLARAGPVRGCMRAVYVSTQASDSMHGGELGARLASNGIATVWAGLRTSVSTTVGRAHHDLLDIGDVDAR